MTLALENVTGVQEAVDFKAALADVKAKGEPCTGTELLIDTKAGYGGSVAKKAFSSYPLFRL